MGYRSNVACVMYAVRLPLSDKTDTEAGQNIVNVWLKQRIPEQYYEFFKFTNEMAVFSIAAWKWYPDYEEVITLENLFEEFAELFCNDLGQDDCGYALEFLRVGEDYTDVEYRNYGNTQERLSLKRTITID